MIVAKKMPEAEAKLNSAPSFPNIKPCDANTSIPPLSWEPGCGGAVCGSPQLSSVHMIFSHLNISVWAPNSCTCEK